MKRSIYLIIIIVLLLIILRFFYAYIVNIKLDSHRKASQIPAVKIIKVQSKDLNRVFESTARVYSKYRVDVSTRISGYLIKSYFKEGDFVKANQVLFEIEPQEYIYALEKARANLSNAQAQFSYYEKQLTRYKELVTHDYISKSEYDNVLAQHDAYRSTVLRYQNELNDAERNLSYTKIKAPLQGKVGIIDVTVGNYVTPTKGPLTTINSYDPMYVTFYLDRKEFDELNRIDKTTKNNRQVNFIFSNGEKYEYNGVQDFWDNKVDIMTGTITMRATFPNPEGKLINGDFGKILIYTKYQDKVPVVPITSVMENQEGQYVYILDKQNLPRITYIKTLQQDEQYVYIKSGLKIGDIVINEGLQQVIPGKPVNIFNKDS